MRKVKHKPFRFDPTEIVVPERSQTRMSLVFGTERNTQVIKVHKTWTQTGRQIIDRAV